MVAVACPGPDRCPGQGRGQLGTLGPEHLGGELLGLGEGVGVVGGLGLVCLVAVDGGLRLFRSLGGDRHCSAGVARCKPSARRPD